MKIQYMFRPLLLLGATAIGLAAFSFFTQLSWQQSLWGWLVLVVVSILTFLPLVGMIIILLVPRKNEATIKWVAFTVALMAFVFSAGLYANFMGLPGEGQVPRLPVGLHEAPDGSLKIFAAHNDHVNIQRELNRL